MKRLNQTKSPFFVILCVLCFQRQSFLTFTLLYGSWCFTVWWPSKVSPYIIIVQVIFYFLWDHWVHSGYFENRIPLKPALGAYATSQITVLHMKRLDQTESPIFVILYVLCFQRQSFLTFILLYCSCCCVVWRP